MSDPDTTAPATLGDHLRHWPQYLLPQRWLTRLTYRVTRIRAPWFKNALIRGFARGFGVNLDEALDPDPRTYPDFNAFFTRALKPEVRRGKVRRSAGSGAESGA